MPAISFLDMKILLLFSWSGVCEIGATAHGGERPVAVS
jgi:hypothetical protein